VHEQEEAEQGAPYICYYNKVIDYNYHYHYYLKKMNGGRGLDFNSRTALCRKACKGISSPHAMSKSEE
jgi:hypothetical protein